jgi:hypothetical protein
MLVLALAVLSPPLRGAEALSARNVEAEGRLRRDVTFLASDDCEGRGPLTRGINLAADYIAAEFKKAGLKPGLPNGSYFQPFTLPCTILEARPRLVLKGPLGQVVELREGNQFQPFGMGHAGSVSAPAVFAGYGVTAKWDVKDSDGPDQKRTVNYDDYAGMNAAGKIVFILRDAPRMGVNSPETGFDPPRRRQLASLTEKLANAEKHKAAAVLFINDGETARTGDELLSFNYTALARTNVKVPVFHVRRSVLETMLRTAGAELTEFERDIDRDLKPRSLDLTGWTISLDLNVKRDKTELRNIVGVLEGSGPLAKETVVVGAHYDHLGFGSGSSLANLKKMAIHHGADDNGSGTTGLLELARRFGALHQREGRRLVFIAFSGEELGLFGSDHYCKHPLFPLNSGAVVAAVGLPLSGAGGLPSFPFVGTASMFNIDMIGRLRPDPTTKQDKLLVEGSGSAKTFNDLLETLNQKHRFSLSKKAGGAGPSDHASFYGRKIPVIFFWTGYHDDYHRPSDTADKINVEGLRRVVDLSEDVVTQLATVRDRPEFVEVKSAGAGSPSHGPRLGVRPAAPDGKEGVVIEEVVAGEPAANAGIKKGDRIVVLAGQPIKAFENLVAAMAGQRYDTTIDVGISRDGKNTTVQVKLPFIPRLGIRPNYGDEKEGVLIDGVSDGMPAAGAGLKAGDRIVELGGKPVKDLEAYMQLLPAAVKGDTVDAGIVREGKKIAVKIKVR